jgi:hypothetical protein
MDGNTFLIVMIIGGIFILLGIIGIVWGRRESSSYYSSVSERTDVREFLDHSPGRPEPGALRTGGKISILLGIVVILFALGFHFWG